MQSKRALWNRAASQHGIVTSSNLHDGGVTRSERATLVSRGVLVPVGRRTYRIAGSPETVDQRVMIACLDAGGVAVEGTACWLHGLGGFGPGDPPSVVSLESRRDYRVPDVAVHSSTRLGRQDLVHVRGIPTVGVARALFSTAAAVPRIPRRVVANAIDEAVRDGKATDAWLWDTLDRIRCRGRNGVSVFESILEARVAGPTESWLEREFLRLMDVADLPRPSVQRIVRRDGKVAARVDFSYDDLGLVVEVTGRVGHSLAIERAHDARRRNSVAAVGLRTIEFTYEQLVDDAPYVMAEMRALVAGVDLVRP